MRRTVAQVMTRDVVTVSETASLKEAHQLLRDHGFQHLFVVDDEGELVGMMSDRDVGRTLSSPSARHGSIEREQVLDGMLSCRGMRARPVTVSPETPVEAAIRLMLQNQLQCLPVVRAGKLIGLLTQSACLELCTELLAQLPAKRSGMAASTSQRSSHSWSEVL